jgi:hypothetical protein
MQFSALTSATAQSASIVVADAHGDDGKLFVVHADEKLTVFMELEAAIRARQSAGRIAERVK